MTGKGHRMTGLGAGFFAAALARLVGFSPEFEIISGVIAAFSTTLPDWLEIPIVRHGQRIGSIIAHRTITHWGGLWLTLLCWGLYTGGLAGVIAVGAAAGSLFHLIGDAPNLMGVPWLWPTRRLRLGKNGWWASGQNEVALIVFLTALGVGFWWFAHWYGEDTDFSQPPWLSFLK